MPTTFQAEHSKLMLLDSCLPDMPAPNPALSAYWELDEKIRAEFSGPIQMWEQGLLTCAELLQNLQCVMNQQRQEISP